MSIKKLFISHAVKDKPLLDKFIDLLDTGCGVNRDDIFYTSDTDLGIEPGRDFIQYIKDNLTEASVVILILTPNYLESRFCLAELGATWVLPVHIYPLVTSPLNFSDIGGLLQSTHMGKIDNQDDLARLHDTIIDLHGITRPKTATWERKRDQFLRELPAVIGSLPQPKNVPVATYDKLHAQYLDALDELTSLGKVIATKDSQIEQLKALKDREAVQEFVLANSSAKEQFDSLVSETNSALDYLPQIVKRMFYYDHVGDRFIPEDNRFQGINDYSQALEAKQNGYLVEPSSFSARDNGEFDFNLSHRRVMAAQKAITTLAEFIREVDDSDFLEWFYEENDYPLDQAMGNLEFWRSTLF